MSVSVEKLFYQDRFPKSVNLLFVILYIPLGLLLVILRLFISLQLFLAFCVLPNSNLKQIALRIFYAILGLIVSEEKRDKNGNSRRIIICNHITPFDHLAVSLIYPCVTLNKYDLPSLLLYLLSYCDLGANRGRDSIKTNAKAYLAQSGSHSLLLHPEGTMTNGVVALMKYGSWAFEVEDKVLAIGISVHRLPILPILPSVLGASWIADLFFMLFSPCTLYKIKHVGCLEKGDNETTEDFASRVQKLTALVLKIESSNHTVADKVEYVKRLAREAAAANNPFLNPEIHSMAIQVKEVLPYLPLDTIKRDLIQTRSVDLTITNFLEGNTPEPIPSTSQVLFSPPSNQISGTRISATTSDSSHLTSSSGIVSFDTSAKTFGKSANVRMQSLEERKKQLIENARRMYAKRHGLTLSCDSVN